MKLFVLVLSLLLFGNAFCQVRIVVPFPPGGSDDALARLMAPKLSEIWKEPVIVENKPGASGHIGADFVAQSPGDGKTLLMSSTASLTEKNVQQFAPVTLVSASPYVVTASTKTNFTSIRELISFARANPGKLTFGSGSSSSRIAGEMLKSLGGIDIVHVPYRSNPQAVTDILGGQIALFFADISTTLPQVKAGKVKGFAVSTAQRSKLAPELPTMAEAGVPGYDLAAWFAAFAPAGTPKPVVDKLRDALVAAVSDKAVQERLLAAGIEPESSTSEALKAFVGTEIKKWADIVKAAGIQPE